jgi:hypothetical protein
MAKLTGGILGGFSGKVGNVVGGFWKGIPYMRMWLKPSYVDNANTQRARGRMKFLMWHGRAANESILKLGYDFVTKGKKLAPINKFIQTNLKDNDPVENFFNTQYSEGNVTPVILTSAEYNPVTHNLSAVVVANQVGYASGTDKIIAFIKSASSSVVDWVYAPADNMTRADFAAAAGTGMYKILASKKKEITEYDSDLILYVFCLNEKGEASPTAAAWIDEVIS